MLISVLVAVLLPALAYAYTVVRKDGRTFTGELLVQNPQETIIKGTDGVVLKFRAEQIDWVKTTDEIRKPEQASIGGTSAQAMTYETRELTMRRKWTGERLTFDFKDIDIRDFFRLIADLTGLNMIVDPAVKGTLTMKMHDVPWDQALDLVCRTFGLGYQIEGNVLNVEK